MRKYLLWGGDINAINYNKYAYIILYDLMFHTTVEFSKVLWTYMYSYDISHFISMNCLKGF